MGGYRTRLMEIQPTSFGDALGQLIKILGKVWRPLLMPALVVSLITAGASYLILDSAGSLDFLELTFNNPDAIEAMTDEQIVDELVGFFSAFIWVGITSAMLYGFLYLVAARAVGEELSEQPSGRSLVGVAITLSLGWLIASVIIWAGVMLGTLLLIVPGVWLGISLSLVAPVMAIEQRGPMGSIRRSYRLVKGNWWETFGFLLLIGLIGGTASQFVQLVAVPAFLVGNPSFAFGISIAFAIAIQGVIVAAIGVGFTVWYLNLRARTDGPFVLQLS